ncbi:MAG: hypothetical protein WCG50_02525 [Rhodoferax sp.]|uniref:hypothetical protein n=1 Tax=Rhodoferax sp. TaxID=50421 RepID=UPI003018CD5D
MATFLKVLGNVPQGFRNKKGVHTGFKTLSRDEAVGTPLSGYEVPNPPLDPNPRLALAGYGVI